MAEKNTNKKQAKVEILTQPKTYNQKRKNELAEALRRNLLRRKNQLA